MVPERRRRRVPWARSRSPRGYSRASRARPDRHQHVPERRRGRRSAASSPIRSRALRRTRGAEIEVFVVRSPGGSAPTPKRRAALRPAYGGRPLRHRARPLRADRVAGAGGAGPRAARDAARHRSRPPPFAAGDAGGAAVPAISPASCRSRWPQRSPAGRPADGWRCCPAASTCTASSRSTAREARRRAGALAGRAVPAVRRRSRRAPRSATTCALAAAGDVPLLTLGDVAPGRGAAVGQCRQRRAGALRPRGLRARGAGGARLRRAGAGDAGRDRARGPRRRARAPCARRST